MAKKMCVFFNFIAAFSLSCLAFANSDTIKVNLDHIDIGRISDMHVGVWQNNNLEKKLVVGKSHPSQVLTLDIGGAVEGAMGGPGGPGDPGGPGNPGGPGGPGGPGEPGGPDPGPAPE